MQLPIYLGGIISSLTIVAIVILAVKNMYSLAVAVMSEEPVSAHLKTALISIAVAVFVIAATSPLVVHMIRTSVVRESTIITLPR